MTEEFEKAIREPDFLGVCGSRLYGTNRPDSDHDLRGFVLPPLDYIINLEKKDEARVGEDDHKIFPLKRFMWLVMVGDPLLTDLFFLPPDKVVRITEIGQMIIDARSLFFSNRIYNRIMGYGNSEWRKAIGVRLEIEDRPKDEDDIIAWIRDNKDWEKERMDMFCEWMDEDRDKKLVPGTRKLGAKRKAEFDKYGFGVTSAAHSIRLLTQLIEFMKTGKMTFPLPNADFLRGIRQGKVTLEEATKVQERLTAEAESVRPHSVLPDKPNENAIKALYREIVIKKLGIL